MNLNIGHLRDADIIVSTTDQAISKTIRAGIGASVSHAMLYVGGREVIEAVGQGVRQCMLSHALSDASLAIALRRPGLSLAQRSEVVGHALSFKGRPYDEVGAAGAGTTNRRGKVIAMGGCLISFVGCAVASRAVAHNASPSQQDKAFFCSELVSRAFELAGVPIVDSGASFTNPRTIRTSRHLHYVSQLI